MGELDRMPKSFTITFKADDKGFVGRECPHADCESYFKIDLETGPRPNGNASEAGEADVGEIARLSCPYCGVEGDIQDFTTNAQLEYAKSVVYRQFVGALVKDLKKLEFDIKPKGMFGIGFSMKLKPGPTPSLRYYREEDLETEVVCDCCRFRFTIYGVFGYCPACRSHNSVQILDRSLAVAEKLLDRASKEEDPELESQIVGDALSKAVAAFDGFGRCICAVNVAKASDAKLLERLSFQNLSGAQQKVQQLFGFDFAAPVAPAVWDECLRAFQKRHLLAHSMGVIDEEYVKKTNDRRAIVGRKVEITHAEVRSVCSTLRRLGTGLRDGLTPQATPPIVVVPLTAIPSTPGGPTCS
jgi:hypothetical protein